MTQHPTVHSNDSVTGCAVVFGRECPPITFGDLTRESFATIVERLQDDPLANWIHRVGVVELKRLIEHHSEVRFADRYANICHLCGDILSNPAALGVLKELGLLPAQRAIVPPAPARDGHAHRTS